MFESYARLGSSHLGGFIKLACVNEFSNFESSFLAWICIIIIIIIYFIFFLALSYLPGTAHVLKGNWTKFLFGYCIFGQNHKGTL